MKPLTFTWDGNRLIPANFMDVDGVLVAGESYRVDIIAERTAQSHGHYFAVLSDLWGTLPERLTSQFASPEILRKFSLIMTGYRHERTLVLDSNEQAARVAAFLRSGGSDYQIISVNENVIVEWKPMSQSRAAMPSKDEFQKSKTDVIRYIEELLADAP